MIPRFNISAGAMTADSESLTNAGLPVSVRVDLRLNQINTAEIRLGLVPGKTIELGDAVTIELGDAEQGTEKVFSGIVTELKQQTKGYTIWCSSSMQTLTQIQVNKVYEQQNAGDIVTDIASIAALKTAEIEAGLSYPFYALGADRHLLAHLHALAKRDGFDLYADTEDKMVYAAYSASGGHNIRYGADVLDYNCENQVPKIEGVEVYGESPASLGEGDKAYSWLTKEEVKGNAGSSSGNIFRLADPSIRNQDAAGTAAEKILASFSTQKQGWVEFLGNPAPQLGGTISLSDLPNGGPEGDFQVLGIRHQLDKKRGFTTIINWKEN